MTKASDPSFTLCITGSSEPAMSALKDFLEKETSYPLVSEEKEAWDLLIYIEETAEKCPDTGNKPCLIISPGTTDKVQNGQYVMQSPIRLSHILEQIHAIEASRASNMIAIRDCVLDMKARTLHKNNETIRLTEKECAILAYLKEQAPQPVNREDLLQNVWGYANGIDTHTIETHIYRLRQKIENDPADARLLVTDKEGGYVLGDDSSD